MAPASFLIYALISLNIVQYLMLFSANTLHSILFLILAFFNGFVFSLQLQIEFVGFLFLIIYVGAIAVLFLFVVMMLDIKGKSDSNDSNFFLVSLMLYVFVGFYIKTENKPMSNDVIEFIVKWDTVSDIYVFGQALYSHYYSIVLLIGMLLLLAVIGSLLLVQVFDKKFLNGPQLKLSNVERSKAKSALVSLYK